MSQTLVVGHPGRLTFAEIMGIVAAVFHDAVPLIVQTFPSKKVMVGSQLGDLSLTAAQAIVDGIQAAHEAQIIAPDPVTESAPPLASTVRGVVR